MAHGARARRRAGTRPARARERHFPGTTRRAIFYANGCASGARISTTSAASPSSRPALQTGYMYHYAFAMLIGVAAFITWFMFAGGGH